MIATFLIVFGLIYSSAAVPYRYGTSDGISYLNNQLVPLRLNYQGIPVNKLSEIVADAIAGAVMEQRQLSSLLEPVGYALPGDFYISNYSFRKKDKPKNRRRNPLKFLGDITKETISEVAAEYIGDKIRNSGDPSGRALGTDKRLWRY